VKWPFPDPERPVNEAGVGISTGISRIVWFSSVREAPAAGVGAI